MKLITGGVGIDAMSVSDRTVRLYGNDKFYATHRQHPLRMSKMRRTPEGWEVDFIRDPDGNRVFPSGNYFIWQKVTPRMVTKRFGKTTVTDVVERPNGFTVSLPLDLAGSLKMVPFQREKRRAEPELPLADPEPVQTAPVPEPELPPDITRVLESWAEPEPEPVPTLNDLQQAVRLINRFVAQSQGSIVLSVEGGRLRAMMEID